MEHGIIRDWNDMERIWHYIFSKEQLQTVSEEVFLDVIACLFPLCLNYNYNYNRDLLCAPYKQNNGALHCHEVLTIKAVLNTKVLRRLLKVSIEHVVVFSSDGS